jgi:hypothetical protein
VSTPGFGPGWVYNFCVVPAKLRDTKLLPITLVVALLACHGAAGALHQIPAPPATEHPSASELGAFSGQHLIHHLVGLQPCFECDAVLPGVIVGATLALLLASARAWRKICAPPLTAWSLRTVFVASLPLIREALFPFLQVFRL